jgi:hypothetical protein
MSLKKILLTLHCTIRIYYQYDVRRLSTCTLTIHGLLHICDNIRFCAPVWVTWTFFMERYCGSLQGRLRSRSHPWANLNNQVLNRAHLDMIDMRYNLTSGSSRRSADLTRGEKVYNSCMTLLSSSIQDLSSLILLTRSSINLASTTKEIFSTR